MRLDGRATPSTLWTRMDTHCHSWASDGPAVAALSFLDVPECYSPPEKVYEQARARGMDLVTITDHDTIRGAMELLERGFEGFIVGQEVTVAFPEDRCKLHVLVCGGIPGLEIKTVDAIVLSLGVELVPGQRLKLRTSCGSL